jgi:hypothetical protein
VSDPVINAGERPKQARNSNGEYFLNPYNFILPPDRKKGENDKSSGLSDGPAPPRGTLAGEHLAAVIPISITARTPILVPDQNRAIPPNPEKNRPRVLRTHCGPDDLPMINPSSVKGMLRSAYEAITNSRYGVMSESSKTAREFRHPRGKKIPYRNSPADLAEDSGHLPARDESELSPADRMFGWVRQGDVEDRGQTRRHEALRGALRIDPLKLVSDPVVVRSGLAVRIPLATLAEPKSSQYRFYATNSEGALLSEGAQKSREEGFNRQKQGRLRGWKVYLPPTEVLQADHSNDAEQASSAAGYWDPESRELGPGKQVAREYRRRIEQKVRPALDSDIEGFIPVGTRYTTTLRIQGVTVEELSALFWLLALPEGAVLRLGLGKPLGFGAVEVKAVWDEVRIDEVIDLQLRYRSMVPDSAIEDSDECWEASNLISHYDCLLSRCDHLKGLRDQFLDAAFGYAGAAVHYPRFDLPGEMVRPPEGKNWEPRLYEWWGANETGRKPGEGDQRDRTGQRKSLPFLGEEDAPVLPYDPTEIVQ